MPLIYNSREVRRTVESDDFALLTALRGLRSALYVVTYSTASAVPAGEIATRGWGRKRKGGTSGYSPREGYGVSGKRINGRTNDPPKLRTSFCLSLPSTFFACFSSTRVKFHMGYSSYVILEDLSDGLSFRPAEQSDQHSLAIM